MPITTPVRPIEDFSGEKKEKRTTSTVDNVKKTMALREDTVSLILRSFSLMPGVHKEM